jgi:uncharacterized protein YybS (DUF2232 family)
MSTPVSARAGMDRRQASVLGSALFAALLFTMGLTAPSWGLDLLVVTAIAAPFPFVILRIQGSGASVLAATFLATAIVGTLSSMTGALAFVALVVIPGLLLGESLVRGRGLLRGCMWAGAATTIEAGSLLLLAGSRVASIVHGWIERLRSPELLEQFRVGGLSNDRLAVFGEQLERLAEVLALLYPGLMVLLGGALVLINAALVRAYLARRDPAWLEDGEFERLRWPLGLAVLFVTAVGCLTFHSTRVVSANLLLVLGFLFALQGLAILAFYVRRLASPWLRMALILLVVASPWAVYILALLGLFDNWLNARRWAEVPAK